MLSFWSHLPTAARGVLLGTLLLAPSACHDRITAPRPITFDAEHALSRVEPIAALFDQPVFVSFEGALRYFQLSQIPDSILGKTFVFDTTARTYVVDPTAAPIPAGSVSYVLYTWGGANGGPALPLSRIGFVLLFPTSPDRTPGEQQVEVGVFRDRPFLGVSSFVVMHGLVNGVNVFGIRGAATDGLTSADDIIVDGSESGTNGATVLTFNTTIHSTASGVTSVEQLTYDQATASSSGKLQLTYDGHELTDQSVPGTGAEVRFDGDVYARIVFPTPSGQTQYVRPDGTSLSSKEIADLNALLYRVVAANFVWINLAFP